MTQPEKFEPLTLSAPASVVVAKAALAVCDHPNDPTLQSELHDRLGMVMDAMGHLESITCEAGFHGIDLSFQSLYGVLRLINREVKVIEALVDALCKYGEA